MKILYITPYNPVDSSCGGDVRSGALLRALRGCGEVRTVIVPGRVRKVFGTESSVGAHVIKSSLLYSGRLPWAVFVFLSSLFRRPLWGFPKRDGLLEKMEMEGFDYDVVVVRYLWCAARMGVWRLGKPVYVDVDDSPKAVGREIAEGFPVMVRPLIRWMYCTWQAVVAKRMSGFWYSNVEDVGMYGLKTSLLPNVPQVACAEPHEGDIPYVFFVGSFRHLPNLKGVDWFLDCVWGGVRALYPQIRMKIAGMALPDSYREKWLRLENVDVLGYVDNLSDLYSKCVAVVVPQIGGAGTSVKLIEAVSCGCKVFSNKAGARGLASSQLAEMCVSVFEDKNDFLQALKEWMSLGCDSRREKRVSIACAAKLMQDECGFEKAVAQMIVS